MTDSDALAQDQQRYLQMLRENWANASEQATLLSRLSLHHGQAIARSQAQAARATMTALAELAPALLVPKIVDAFAEYTKDRGQRWILFLDTLCQRGDACIAREKEGFKPVLAFDYDIIVDGRTLVRPVNYALVRIHPPAGTMPPREDGRPWVIIDPRAGHGSGIGGFKSESEVGVALKDGHPVYFVIFFPEPEPGQTLADVCAAEATFLREVYARHPRSPRPLITGNCQGGWATMILAATHPDLMGPIVIAGAPLSYWSGENGRNPFRYFGGVAGGAVPALLASDFGGGKFDGANLVMNFELLNPGKTWFRKNFDLFARIDSEAARFLEFERWWSGFYFMNGDEIRWIVENLFVGNKLTRGDAALSDGTPVDLTRIDAPIVVFASHGDNITPPQQALNWIPDLYGSANEIAARGHIIIYTLHESIGHLGIFVSAQVANKQHEQIGSVVKTIESLAPGLYEMLIEKHEGAYTVAFEARTIDDILKLGGDRQEEVEFAAVAGFSEWAAKYYELTWQPLLRALITPAAAEARKRLHPMRQQHYFFSRKNPLFATISDLGRHGPREARAGGGAQSVRSARTTLCRQCRTQLGLLSRHARRRDRAHVPCPLWHAVDEADRCRAAGAAAIPRRAHLSAGAAGDQARENGRLCRRHYPHAGLARPRARRGAARSPRTLRPALARSPALQLDDAGDAPSHDPRAIGDRGILRRRRDRDVGRYPQGPGGPLSRLEPGHGCSRTDGTAGCADCRHVQALPGRTSDAGARMARPGACAPCANIRARR